MSLFQPHGVHKEPGLGQNHQSHLCCCLDNTSPRPACSSASAAASGCSMPDLEAVPVSPCLCPPRRPQTFTYKSPCLSRRARKCTIDFHSQVSLLSRHARKCTIDVHSQVSHLSRRACKCTVDFHSQVTSLLISPIREGSPLWHGSLFVVQSSCSCETNTPQCATSSVRRTPTVGLVLLVV